MNLTDLNLFVSTKLCFFAREIPLNCGKIYIATRLFLPISELDLPLAVLC